MDPDETVIINHRPMDDSGMTDGDVFPNGDGVICIGMQDTAILDVRPLPNGNSSFISTDDSMGEHPTVLSNGHIPKYNGTWRDIA
jgi:hypothetical protein